MNTSLVRQYYLECPISKEIYAANISNDCCIIGIYGPIHHTGILKKYLGKYGTTTDDIKWAMGKKWFILMLDNQQLIVGYGMEIN